MSVVTSPLLGGGVRVTVEGTDRDGVEKRRAEWAKWAEGLPKRGAKSSIDQRREGPSNEAPPRERPEDPARETGQGREFRAATVEEAVEAASVVLGVEKEDVSFEVLDHGSQGLLGVGRRDARISVRTSESSEAEQEPTPSGNERALVETTRGKTSEGYYYYTPEQAARLLGKDTNEVGRMIYQNQLPAVLVNEQPWIPAESVEVLVKRRHGGRKPKEAPKPRKVRLPAEQPSANATQENVAAKDADSRTAPLADNGLGYDGRLPRTRRSGSGDAGLSLQRTDGHEEESRALIARLRWYEVDRLVAELEKLEAERREHAEGTDAPSQETDAEARQEIANLEGKVKDLQKKLRAVRKEKKELAGELERERAEHVQNVSNIRLEIDQLNTEMDRLRHEDAVRTQTMRADLEQERSRSIEGEQRAEALHSQLEQEMALRLDAETSLEELIRRKAKELEESKAEIGELEEALSSEKLEALRLRREIGWMLGESKSIRLGFEEREKALEAQLELERALRTENEQWIKDLQAELEKARSSVSGEYEARLAALGVELEKEKAQRLLAQEALEELKRNMAEKGEVEDKDAEVASPSEESEVLRLREERRLLDEVRKLLGQSMPGTSQGADQAAPIGDARTKPDETTSGEIIFQTQHGSWNFRPPFVLEEEEVELMRLVAGQYGITAEQIRRKKGRRSVEKLNDLLDRLLAEGMEPITEDDDFYSFNPDYLND